MPNIQENGRPNLRKLGQLPNLLIKLNRFDDFIKEVRLTLKYDISRTCCLITRTILEDKNRWQISMITDNSRTVYTHDLLFSIHRFSIVGSEYIAIHQ